MDKLRSKYLELAEADLERTQKIRNCAKERQWKRLYEFYGKKMGLTYNESKAFGKYLIGHAEVEQKPQRQKVEVEKKDDDTLVVDSRGPRIRNLDDLLTTAKVDRDRWGVDSYKVNTWEVASRNSDGEMEVTPVWQVKAQLSPLYLESLEPVVPTGLYKRQKKRPRQDNILRALFVPDSQHGFRWVDKFRNLSPTHDRVSVDCAVRVAEYFNPDVIVFLGDMLDLAPWSTRYPTDPSMRQTTQPTLGELHWQLKQFRVACPSARMIYMGGNHELRLSKTTQQVLEEASELRFADDNSESAPLLSIERLLALEALDIEYVGEYAPGRDWWLWERIRIHHGSTVKSGGGATVTARLKGANHSEVFGHIHRFELAQKTVSGPEGKKTITAMSPGCLCRTDGSVPGVSVNPDWQHGLGVAYVDLERDTEHMSLIPIHDGTAIFDGRVFVGEDMSETIAEETGYPQIFKGKKS